MPDKAGVKIGGTEYEFAEKFKLGDAALIEEVSGLDWNAFTDRLAKSMDLTATGRIDMTMQAALIAVAVQNRHPTWSRGEVVAFVTNVEFEALEYFGPPEKEGDPEVPQSASDESSDSSDATSEPPPESESNQTPQISGDPGSDITTPDLRQVV